MIKHKLQGFFFFFKQTPQKKTAYLIRTLLGFYFFLHLRKQCTVRERCHKTVNQKVLGHFPQKTYQNDF